MLATSCLTGLVFRRTAICPRFGLRPWVDPLIAPNVMNFPGYWVPSQAKFEVRILEWRVKYEPKWCTSPRNQSYYWKPIRSFRCIPSSFEPLQCFFVSIDCPDFYSFTHRRRRCRTRFFRVGCSLHSSVRSMRLSLRMVRRPSMRFSKSKSDLF